MSRAAVVELVVVLLLAAVAGVFYLEWWRSGELELLNRRVDELELRTRPKQKKAAEVKP